MANIGDSQISSKLKTKIKQKNIKKIIKKDQRVSIMVSFLYMFQMSDIVHQSFIRQNEQSNITSLPYSFYFKTMKCVQFSQNVVTLNIKTIKKQIKSFSDYRQQFKQLAQSGKNSILYDWGVSFQFVCVGLKAVIQKFSKIDHNSILSDYIQKMKQRHFIVAVFEQKQDQICVGKIVLSRSLIEEMGYTVENMKQEYIKYQHVEFQIMSEQFFKKLYVMQGARIKKLMNKEDTQSQTFKNDKPGFMAFDDFVFRKKYTQISKDKDKYQQKLKAVIQLYKPHPKLGIIQFTIDSQNIIETIQTSSRKLAKLKYRQQEEKQTQKDQQTALEHVIKKRDPAQEHNNIRA